MSTTQADFVLILVFLDAGGWLCIYVAPRIPVRIQNVLDIERLFARVRLVHLLLCVCTQDIFTSMNPPMFCCNYKLRMCSTRIKSAIRMTMWVYFVLNACAFTANGRCDIFVLSYKVLKPFYRYKLLSILFCYYWKNPLSIHVSYRWCTILWTQLSVRGWFSHSKHCVLSLFCVMRRKAEFSIWELFILWRLVAVGTSCCYFGRFAPLRIWNKTGTMILVLFLFNWVMSPLILYWSYM